MISNDERKQLHKEVIESEKQRIEHLNTFLNELTLDSDVNKTVALELLALIDSINQDLEKLKGVMLT